MLNWSCNMYSYSRSGRRRARTETPRHHATLSAQSAYSGAAAPAGKTTVFTGSKNAHIYRTATPSQAAPMLVAQPKQARSEMVYMSGAKMLLHSRMTMVIDCTTFLSHVGSLHSRPHRARDRGEKSKPLHGRYPQPSATHSILQKSGKYEMYGEAK